MRIHLSLLNLAALLCVFTSPTFAPPPPPLAQVPSASSLVSTSSTSSHSVSTHHSEIDEPLPELLHSVSQDYESLDTLETADEIPGLDENIVSLKSVCPVESPTTSRSLFDFSSKFLAKIEGVNVSSLSPLERQVVEAVKDKDEDGLIELLQCVICYTPLGYKNMVSKKYAL